MAHLTKLDYIAIIKYLIREVIKECISFVFDNVVVKQCISNVYGSNNHLTNIPVSVYPL